MSHDWIEEDACLMLRQLHANAANDDKRDAQQAGGVETFFEEQEGETVHQKRIATRDCYYVRCAGHA